MSQPQGHSAAGMIMSMKNSNDTIGNRTRGLRACGAVPQRTALPRAPKPMYYISQFFLQLEYFRQKLWIKSTHVLLPRAPKPMYYISRFFLQLEYFRQKLWIKSTHVLLPRAPKHMYYISQFFLQLEYFRQKLWIKSTYVLRSILFPPENSSVYEIMWKNLV
jgi:hypothetical protein